MNKNYEMIINNQKVFEFYQKNKNLNFEQVNLLSIALFENILHDANISNNNLITSQILAECLKNNHKIDQLIFSNKELNIKLTDIKKDYVEEVKIIINNDNEITNKINLSNTNIIEKIQFILNTIFNDKINKQIQDELQKFQIIIHDETKKFHDETKKNTHLEQFTTTIDTKFNSLLLNIQQPILEATTKQQSGQDRMFSSLEEFLDRYRNNSSFKGKIAENHLKLILEENIENAEIIDKSNTPHSCDLLLHRNNKQNILIENKSYTYKVPTIEIEKFKNDCKSEKTHGIILSQFSKITLKNNYQIEIEEDIDHNKIILVYVADVKDDFQKIQIAINIIDILAEKVQKTNNDIQLSISKEILEEINEEFNKLIIQKQNIMLLIKDFQRKINISIEEINLPSLKKYIEFSLNIQQQITSIECSRCKKFQAKSKSSLASHQKSKECLKIFNENKN